MLKRTENVIMDDDFDVPAKRAKFDCLTTNFPYDKKSKNEVSKNRNAQDDDAWGDDFAEEDIKEMDFVESQACLLVGNMLDDSKFENTLCLIKSDLKKPAASVSVANCSEISQSKLPVSVEKPNIWLKKMEQGIGWNSHDVTDVNYSQFRNKLMDGKDHNSTFHKERNFIVPDDRELERLKNENKKLLEDFKTKDGETIFLRQQLRQMQLRVENEKLQKMHLIEDQTDRHRLEMHKVYKEKEHLKTQIELQSLEIGNLLQRCKQLESGSIKLKEPQLLNTNTSFSKSNASLNCRPTNANKHSAEVKEVCVQANIYKKNDYQLKTCNNYYFLTRISELMFGTVPEKPVINIKVIEKTGKRNLPILQEGETFRIFENPDLVKPMVTIVNGKKLTAEFVLLELATIEKKVNVEIESESCTPIINKLVLTTRELMLNVITILQTISHAMRNDDIRDMNDLYLSTIYENHYVCVKSECEADAWHKGERGIEARRLLSALSHVSSVSSYLSNYLAGKSPLHTCDDENYNRYLPQMTRYSMWPKKNHKFEMLEMIQECAILIGRVRRSHQFTGLISAIVKLLCNVHEKVGYCERGLAYVYLVFKELVFSKPLSLCYASLTRFIMVFSRCSVFISKLCRGSQSVAITNWKGALHFTQDACVLQILITQMECFQPDFLTILNMTHALIFSVRNILQITNNSLLRTESLESCKCYRKLLQFTINMLRKCCEIRLTVTDIKRQNSSHTFNKCYILKSINYKDCACQIKCNMQNIEKLDQNYWSTIRNTQHQVLKDGIRFLCHLTTCDPYFVIQLPDIEDSFHLFIKNITFFDDLMLNTNEREALERIQSTYIFDKGIQSETETCATQLLIANFEKKTKNIDKRNTHFKVLYNLRI